MRVERQGPYYWIFPRHLIVLEKSASEEEGESRPYTIELDWDCTDLGIDYVGELTRVSLMSGSVTWLRSWVKSLLTAMSQLREASQPGKAG